MVNVRRSSEIATLGCFVVAYILTTAILLTKYNRDRSNDAYASACHKQILQDALLPSYNCTLISVDQVRKGQSFGQDSTYDIAYPLLSEKLPRLCAIVANVSSSTTSSYTFGMFLPIDKWNQRFLAVGNGGYAGGIDWLSMGNGAGGYGFATMSTDTGHMSTALDASWSFDNPQSVIDWSHRAVHGSTVIAKHLVNLIYGKAAQYNYFSGCSMGGREGLRAAQLYPEDYDGILACSPAWWLTHLPMWTVRLGTYNLPANSTHHIPPPLFPVVTDEFVKQCDETDGVKDSIVMDPRKCQFNTSALLCNSTPPADQKDCLTAPQIDTLNHFYADYLNASGGLVFPRLMPGSELDASLILGGLDDQPSSLGMDYIVYMLGNLNFTWPQYNDSFIQQAEMANPGNASAEDYDLSAFRDRGGKMMTTHGWSDGLISTGSSIVLYNRVNHTLSQRLKHVAIEDWYRLFLVPGMGHCAGTPPAIHAPWYHGGPGQALLLGNGTYGTPHFADAAHDVHLALIDWVEKGQAPAQIISTYWHNDSPHLGVERQRPICPYPQEASYTGPMHRDEINRAHKWECELPTGPPLEDWE